MSNDTTAERIVNFFEAWHDQYSEHRSDPVFQRAAETCGRLKRSRDFTMSARLAAIDAVREILQDER